MRPNSSTPLCCLYCHQPYTPVVKKGGSYPKYCSTECRSNARHGTLEQRVWSKVQKTDGCWIWMGAIDGDGYGLIGNPYRTKPRLLRVTRVVWELTHGEHPGDYFLCHHCDNPICVRPDHLFLGTIVDNTLDMVSKDRHVYGVDCHSAVLNDDKVREIRRYAQGTDTQDALAHEYGVNQRSINKIVRRISWRHVE